MSSRSVPLGRALAATSAAPNSTQQSVDDLKRSRTATCIEIDFPGSGKSRTPPTVSRVVFLGTSSATPTPARNTSAVAVTLSSGSTVLVDCGEATQHRLLHTKTVRMGKIDLVLITHLHGDHCFGLFGLLSTMALNGRDEENPVTVVGPAGIRRMLTVVADVSASYFGHVRVVELPSDRSVHAVDLALPGGLVVHARRIPHVPQLATWGYVFREPEMPGRLDGRLAASLGASGPQLRQLKEGKDVTLADGRVVQSRRVVSAPRPGRRLAFLWDTTEASAVAELCRSCSVVVHEATYDNSLAEKAKEHGHSTAADAGFFARQTGANMLILTHFSSRYETRTLKNGAQGKTKTVPAEPKTNKTDSKKMPSACREEKQTTEQTSDGKNTVREEGAPVPTRVGPICVEDLVREADAAANANRGDDEKGRCRVIAAYDFMQLQSVKGGDFVLVEPSGGRLR